MSKIIVEFIGTFYLVLTIGLTVLGASPQWLVFAPLAIAAGLMAMIYAGGPVSGAHFNPAVTLAIWLRGRLPASEVPGYLLAQLAASAAAAWIAGFLKPDAAVAPGPVAVVPALVAEFLFTFALAYVVFAVTTVKSAAGNSCFGLAIGLVVLAGAYSVGSISKGAFNPAVAVGLCLMKFTAWSNLWIYLVANFAGGAAAAAVFRITHPADR